MSWAAGMVDCDVRLSWRNPADNGLIGLQAASVTGPYYLVTYVSNALHKLNGIDGYTSGYGGIRLGEKTPGGLPLSPRHMGNDK